MANDTWTSLEGDKVLVLEQRWNSATKRYDHHQVDAFDARDINAIRAMVRCSQDAAAHALRTLNERSMSDRSELVRGLAAWHRGERNLVLAGHVHNLLRAEG
jgi:hypothetical protein